MISNFYYYAEVQFLFESNFSLLLVSIKSVLKSAENEKVT